MATAWTASVATGPTHPVTDEGAVFVGDADGTLTAFSLDGGRRCSPTTKLCVPRWTASLGGAVRFAAAVSGDVVFAGAADGVLYAFDARGGQLRRRTEGVSAVVDRTAGRRHHHPTAVAEGPRVRGGVRRSGSGAVRRVG
ncbi:MAG: PQQ-binding-like beta-propeller repeat protein [Acidimicrobiales bacterium]